ncbi:hypothetical protein GCM10023148_24690 [Actinokineospora soli]
MESIGLSFTPADLPGGTKTTLSPGKSSKERGAAGSGFAWDAPGAGVPGVSVGPLPGSLEHAVSTAATTIDQPSFAKATSPDPP